MTVSPTANRAGPPEPRHRAGKLRTIACEGIGRSCTILTVSTVLMVLINGVEKLLPRPMDGCSMEEPNMRPSPSHGD